MQNIEVLCDHKDGGESIPIGLMFDNDVFKIESISRRWKEADATYFEIIASNGRAYLLREALKDALWDVILELPVIE